MINKIIFSLFFLFSFNSYSQDLMEQRLFQVGSYSSAESFLTKKPYHKTSKIVDLSLFGQMNINLLENIKKVSSDKEEDIINFFKNNTGKNQYALANSSLGININNFRQEVSVSGGAIAVANNPIIPEVRGVISQNERLTSSYKFLYKGVFLTPKFSIGRRKYINKEYTTGDIIDGKVDLDFKNTEYKNFTEASLLLENKWGFLNFNAIPITGYFPVDYWDIRLGSKFNFNKGALFGSVSPYYAGDTSWIRNMVLGIEYSPFSWTKGQIFIQNQELNTSVSFDLKYISLEAYYLNQRFDNYNYDKSSQYGINFSLKY